MATVPFIDYNTLEEFYTIPALCKLFQMEKAELRKKCDQYRIQPRRNEIGQSGFVKYDVRKLHNLLYYENHDTDSKDTTKDVDPWA